jgi:glycosyltransferase involved in cell wall biosynthesis
MARVIHVISPVGGSGNRLDLELICPLLQQNGFDVTPYPVADRRRSRRFLHLARTLVRHRRRFEVNLFMGPLFPEWLSFASMNVWIPNPEGFNEQHRHLLPRIDLIVAKTRMTERIFRDLGCRTEFIGFTGRDQFDGQVPRDYTRFFHAGSSPFKGTTRLLEVWQAHPEWPELIAVIHDDKLVPQVESANIRVIREFLPEPELKRLQNATGFHLCCSEVEGFGHYLTEALSCGAVTLATNAPPMNELVQPGRGLLLDCLEETSPVGLSHRAFFRRESLEAAIERARTMDENSRRQIGAAARAFFLENDRLFRQRFVDLMRSL